MSLPVELLSSRNKTENDAVRQDLDINHFIENKEFRLAFENQYIKYYNVGQDILKQYGNLDGLDLDVFRDFLVHIHENLVSIPEYGYNQFTEHQLLFATRVLYDILFIEMPNMVNTDVLENSTNPENLKVQLVEHYGSLYNVLKDLKPNTYHTLKAQYAMAVFDNDLTDLVNNHVMRLNVVM